MGNIEKGHIWNVVSCDIIKTLQARKATEYSPLYDILHLIPCGDQCSISCSKSWTIQNQEHQEEFFALEKSCCIYSAAFKFLILVSLERRIFQVKYTQCRGEWCLVCTSLSPCHILLSNRNTRSTGTTNHSNSQEATLSNNICLTKRYLVSSGMNNYFEVKTTAYSIVSIHSRR